MSKTLEQRLILETEKVRTATVAVAYLEGRIRQKNGSVDSSPQTAAESVPSAEASDIDEGSGVIPEDNAPEPSETPRVEAPETGSRRACGVFIDGDTLQLTNGRVFRGE